MEDYKEETYGERIAHLYDEWYVEYNPRSIETLKELAGGGRALELGIGTGRIALPLLEAGVEVHGVDASQAMLDRLRAKPGGEHIPVSVGNFAEVDVVGKYSLVYVLFNTFFALLTQEEQVRCFENVARHLSEGGLFLIEAFVPDLTRFSGGQSVRAIEVGLDKVKLDVTQVDYSSQQISAQHVLFAEGTVKLIPVKLRYAWPSELDLMARLAGLRLEHRWSDWGKLPFISESGAHISVYAKGIEGDPGVQG